MKHVFMSHTNKDAEFCNAFDTVCARVGIRAFRSEFEKMSAPAWRTIRKAMNESIALFFLIGKELVRSQDLGDPSWRYTQNWIAYEIGLACQQEIDVWAICDDVLINFPMPYINNYLTVSLKHEPAFRYLRHVLEKYKIEQTFPFQNGVVCPYRDCKMAFNLHVKLESGSKIRCPGCLKNMVFDEGY